MQPRSPVELRQNGGLGLHDYSTVLDELRPLSTALADMNTNKLVINNLVSLRRVYGHARSLRCDGNNPKSSGSARAVLSFFICGISPVVCFVRTELVVGVMVSRLDMHLTHAFFSPPSRRLFFPANTRHCLG